MIDTPTPDEVLAVWSDAQRRIEDTYPGAGLEASAIAVQDTDPLGDGTVVVLTYIETGESFLHQCEHLMKHIESEEIPPRWIAHAGGAYEVVTPSLIDVVSMDLQERFKQGDENVREIVAITIVSIDSVVTQSFTVPLLEPTGEPRVNNVVGGIVPDTLRLMVTELNKET